MPAILRASCVIPRSERDGLRVFGPDEDEFTLATDVLERLAERSKGADALETVHLLGRFAASVDAWIPELLGHSATVVRHDSPPGGFRTAIRAVTGEHLGTHAIVAVDTPSSGPDGRWGAAAVALLVGSGPGIEILPADPGSSDAPKTHAVAGVGTPPLTGPAFALYAELGRIRASPSSGTRAVEMGGAKFRPDGPIEWTGHWASPPTPAFPLGVHAPADRAEAHLFAVSEGAYVPRPRYLENLPSRWRFVAQKCGHCEAITFPVRGGCRSCHRSDRLLRVPLPTQGGTVIASTVVARGGQPTEFDDQVDANGPYGVVLVELAPTVRVTLQVSDAPVGSVHIGDRVDTRLRRLYPMEGEWRYGRKAVPAPSPS